MQAPASTAACLPPGEPTRPASAVPPGACDCHAHVLGPFDRYPLAASRPYDPPEAPLAELRRMLDTMGLDRVVIAHVSAHGMDLSATLDAMAVLGERARGVAMLRAGTPRDTIASLDAAGMRGVRLSMAYGSETPLDEASLRDWSARIAEFGWHIAMWPSGLEQLRLLERLAPQLEAPLVLDHLASFGWFADGAVREEGLAVLDGLLSTGKAWLKLSGMYRAGAGAAPWPALTAPMGTLARRHTGRMLWASDWPYVGLTDAATRPTSGALMDWLDTLGLDAAARTQVLVHNPQALYRFPASGAVA